MSESRSIVLQHEGCAQRGHLRFYSDLNGLTREQCDACGLDRVVPRRAPEADELRKSGKYRLRSDGKQYRGPHPKRGHS